MRPHVAIAVTVVSLVVLGWAALCGAQQGSEGAWPSPVPGFVPPKGGEHPRLLFRPDDLAELKKRAQTPEGQAIIKRLRLLLNGRDGESMPTAFNPSRGKQTQDGSGPSANAPPGMYTFSHTAGFGFLYLLTGEKKYADLGRQCMEKAFEEYRDRDNRYSFKYPYGALRAGPSLGWTALGYDLCYNGWDDAFRTKVAQAIANYNEGQWMSLEELVRGARQHPGSNHWGMQVGGGALAVLAIMNDPGVDMKKIAPLLETSKKSMITNMTQGFGDGGYFAEGDGTGSMSSQISFLPALQAWKTAAGQDFITPRPNAQWLSLKWIFLTVPRGTQMDFPGRGGYPHNIWDRDGLSGGGYFGIGCGAVTEPQRGALLWFYNRHLKAADEKNGTPFDTPGPYPHHAILSFVNFPFGEQERNPADVVPRAWRDTKWQFYMFRNRWQDASDIVISCLMKPAKGNMGAPADGGLVVWAFGKKTKWGSVKGDVAHYQAAADGSAVLTMADGTALAIDFSGASGADGMIVMTGPGAGSGKSVQAGGTNFSFLFLTAGREPEPRADGDKVVVGEQTVGFDGKKIVLGKMAGPWTGPKAGAAAGTTGRLGGGRL